jgi:hypothetical protein
MVSFKRRIFLFYFPTNVLMARPMKYGQRTTASTPFQKVRWRNPIVNSHPANQENAEKLCPEVQFALLI